MIAYLKGIVTVIKPDEIVVEVAGIGYRVFFYAVDRISLNQELMVYTYQKVSEDDLSLFGFLDQTAYEFFLRLISVKGIGTRSAMNIMRSTSLSNLMKAIESGDVAWLKSINGIGNKSASQIILDLKGKLDFHMEEDGLSDDIWNEISETLKSLGYRQLEVNQVGKALKGQFNELSLEDGLKLALQYLARKGKV